MIPIKLSVSFKEISLLGLYLVLTNFSINEAIAQQATQEKDRYLLGTEEKLEIIVHIWGEVNRPGEYRVPDDTNVLELISKAGGPTEFSNLSKVTITRGGSYILKTSKKENPGSSGKDKDFSYSGFTTKRTKAKKRVIKTNLKEYLEKEDYEPLPILQPGDVVRVHKNVWYKWQTIIRVVSQVAIVVQLMYWYSRIN